MKRIVSCFAVLLLMCGCFAQLGSSGIQPAASPSAQPEPPSALSASGVEPAGSLPPQEEGLAVNTEVLDLCGSTNAVLKGMGLACEASLVQGGTPKVTYAKQEVAWPFTYVMEDVDGAEAQDAFFEYDGPLENGVPAENPFPDDYVITRVEIDSPVPGYAGDFPEWYTDIPDRLPLLFTGAEGPLLRQDVDTAFGQSPDAILPAPEDEEHFFGNLVPYYYVEYECDGRYVAVAFTKDGDVAFKAVISGESRSDSLFAVNYG